jgi:hypothetical protein
MTAERDMVSGSAQHMSIFSLLVHYISIEYGMISNIFPPVVLGIIKDGRLFF